MLLYEQELARKMVEEMTAMGLFDNIGRGVNRICCTSVDDARQAIDTCQNRIVLDLSLAYEARGQTRKTLLSRINSRIKKLKKEVKPNGSHNTMRDSGN